MKEAAYEWKNWLKIIVNVCAAIYGTAAVTLWSGGNNGTCCAHIYDTDHYKSTAE